MAKWILSYRAFISKSLPEGQVGIWYFSIANTITNTTTIYKFYYKFRSDVGQDLP